MLIKRCFNGLYRVNKKNIFNVPFGKYKTLNIYNKENIISCCDYLSKIKLQILNVDYLNIPSKVDFNKNDFFYLDPPYQPKDDKKGFTQYTTKDFNRKEQLALWDFCMKIDSIGAKFILSNFELESIKSLYKLNKNFRFISVTINHSIGGKSSTFKKADEILITNLK